MENTTPRAEPRMRETYRSATRNRTTRSGQTRRGGKQVEKMSLYEVLMLQCMGAGLIFALVLVLNLFDYEPIREMNEKLQVAIGQHIEKEMLESYTTTAKTYLFSLQKTIFGSENEQGTENEKDVLTEDTEKAEEESTVAEKPVRIDEEVLQQLNSIAEWHVEEEIEKK